MKSRILGCVRTIGAMRNGLTTIGDNLSLKDNIVDGLRMNGLSGEPNSKRNGIGATTKDDAAHQVEATVLKKFKK